VRVVYPTLIEKSEDMYLVFVPDLMIYTEGKDLGNAIEMARDAISLKCLNLEDNKISIPEPSSYSKAIEIAKEVHQGESFNYTDGIVTVVDADLTEYRRKLDRKMVKKNLTIPSWMNVEAERLNLNVSRVLQEALEEKIATLK
jgi:hypothetical protein